MEPWMERNLLKVGDIEKGVGKFPWLKIHTYFKKIQKKYLKSKL
jgi:hypothetical protein